MNSSVISNLVMLTGAAVTVAACDNKQKTKAPTAITLNSDQRRAFGTCVYDIVKDDKQKVTTAALSTEGPVIGTLIKVDGATVATLTMSTNGQAASLNADAKPVAPLTREQLDAAINGAPKCYSDALKAG